MGKKRGRVRYDRIALCVVLPAAAVAIAVSCATRSIHNGSGAITGDNKKISEESSEAVSETVTEEITTEEAGGATVNVVAIGDNLVQTMVYETAMAHATGDETYDFSYCYENVLDLITGGDLNIMNQETPICNDEYEISGSNFNFNSPTELGDYLIDSGINVFSVCNNHILDKGTDGLRAQLDYWGRKTSENKDLTVYGVYRDTADMENIRVREVNGAKVAFLAYTENTNGLSLDENSEIRFTYTSETDLIKSQIEEANEIADIVIVSAHWGDEDTHEVRPGIRAMAQDFVDWGADVIIGTHPHTAQTMEYLERADGSQGFVFYSLGNFISAQTDNFNLVGEVADFDLVWDKESGNVTVENIKVIPAITQYDDGNLSNIRVYPYYDYTEELAAAHGLPYTTSGTYRDWGFDTIDSIIDNNIPEEFQCLTKPEK